MPLHDAARRGDLPRLTALIRFGADVNATDEGGGTALHEAAAAAHAEVCVTLIGFGADPNAADDDGNTPLHRAAMTGDLATMLALIRHGADPTIADVGGRSPIDLVDAEHGTVLLRAWEEFASSALPAVTSPRDDGRNPPAA